eukprot:PhF_6_TR10635/c0_g1_i1/m.17227
MPTKSTYVEDWKRSKHVIEYLCYCRNRWWGGRRNNRCRECDKIAFPCPFKLQKGVAWFDCLHCGRTFTSYANGKKKFWCPCYNGSCDAKVRPKFFIPRGSTHGKKKSKLSHNCSDCNGSGSCPNMS